MALDKFDSASAGYVSFKPFKKKINNVSVSSFGSKDDQITNIQNQELDLKNQNDLNQNVLNQNDLNSQNKDFVKNVMKGGSAKTKNDKLQPLDNNGENVNKKIQKNSNGENGVNDSLNESASKNDVKLVSGNPEDSILPEVFDYTVFLKNNRNPYARLPGLNFDVNMFENLIDAFVPVDELHILLNCSSFDLNRFCNVVYNMDLDHTYLYLSGISRFGMVRVLKGLYKTGNQSAIKAINENFLGIKQDSNDQNNVNITFVSDLGGDGK